MSFYDLFNFHIFYFLIFSFYIQDLFLTISYCYWSHCFLVLNPNSVFFSSFLFLSCNLLISSPSTSYICSPFHHLIFFSRSTSFWISSLLTLLRQTTSETPNSPLSVCWSHLEISILSFSSKSINVFYNTLPSLRRSCFLILSDI